MRVCSPSARNAKATGGFTLIEVMVVIVTLGLLATMVAQNVVGNAERARAEKAAVDCKQIADAARMFFVDKGRIRPSKSSSRPMPRACAISKACLRTLGAPATCWVLANCAVRSRCAALAPIAPTRAKTTFRRSRRRSDGRAQGFRSARELCGARATFLPP
jgi:prepilin-type N-terminal cleavage/methylation domain-containing protein